MNDSVIDTINDEENLEHFLMTKINGNNFDLMNAIINFILSQINEDTYQLEK